MVNFFIGRPIFATVLALLMLLIGGICAFLLPIAQYPQITPAQVQVTTTYTGADALTVAETVTTPIEQQINGVKGMIYFSSDSTSNGTFPRSSRPSTSAIPRRTSGAVDVFRTGWRRPRRCCRPRSSSSA